MKILISYYFFIIYLIINILIINVNCQCKDVEIEFTEDIPTLATTTCINRKPVVTFNNYGSYKQFTITPSPISIITTTVNKIVTFKFDTTYTVSYNVGGDGCTTQTKTFTYPALSPPISTYTITQPKCIYSQGQILLVNGQSGSNYKVESEGESFELNSTKPVIINNSGQWVVSDTSSTNAYTACSETISIDQPSGGHPDLIIQPSNCISNNGSIKLKTPSDYQSISLKRLSDGTSITAASQGLFNSLVSGNYLLTLSSGGCSIQVIPIEIDSVLPRLQFIFTDVSCPAKPKIQVKIDDPTVDPATEQFTMSLAGIPSTTGNILSPTITASETTLPFTFSYKTCFTNFSLPISFPQMDLSYSVAKNEENLLADCSSSTSTSISLHYDKASITDIKVTLLNDGSIVSAATDNTYPIGPNDKLSVTSSCYVNPLYLELPQPEPIIKVEGGLEGIGCWENTTISIYNFLDFSSLKLVPLDAPTVSISIDTSTGQFKNIFRKSYNLVYKYCSNSSVSTRVLNLATTNILPSQYTIEKVDNDLDCLTGKGQVKATFIKSNLETVGPIYSWFTPNDNLPLSFKVHDNCIVNLDYSHTLPSTTPNYLNLNNKPIIKVNNATCLYSNDGSVEINGNGVDINSVIIGDKLFRKSSNGIYGGLNVGTYQVILVYSSINGNGYCGGMKYNAGSITISPTDDTFEFKVKSSLDANCLTSLNDGTITIENSNTFKTLEIIDDSTTTNSAVNGVFSNLASGYHSIKFESLDGKCLGNSKVFVKSAGAQPIIALNILRNATCYSDSNLSGSSTSNVDGDGILSIALYNASGDSLEISKVIDVNSNNLQYSTTTVSPKVIQVSPGNNKEFIIYSNTCAYKQTIDIPLSDPLITYQSIFDFSCLNNYENGIIKSGNNHLLINTVQLSGSTQVINSPFGIHNLLNGQYLTLVKWNSICQAVLPIITKPIPTLTPPTFIITQSSSGCLTDYDLNLKITNPTVYSDISINGQRPDTDGNFFKLPITKGDIIYKEKSSQCIGKLKFDTLTIINNITSESGTGLNKTLETCHGACNGELFVSNSELDESNYYYSSISKKENSKSYLTPIRSVPTPSFSGLSFYGISTTSLLFTKVKKSNPFCVSSKSIEFTSYEPVIVDLDGEVCLPFNNDTDLIVYTNITNPDNTTTLITSFITNNGEKSKLGSIQVGVKLLDDKTQDVILLPTDIKPSYSLVNTNSPSIEIPSSNEGDYDQLAYGQYNMKATISSRQCKRSLVKPFVLNNSTANNFLVKADQFNFCEKVRIAPSDMNSTFNYYITNSTGDTVYQYLNQTGVILSDYLDSSQTYTLKAVQIKDGGNTDYHGSCSIVIQSKICPTENSAKIKLIVGLTLGLLVIAFIITYSIFKLRQRHLNKKNKAQLPHDQEDDDQNDEDQEERDRIMLETGGGMH